MIIKNSLRWLHVIRIVYEISPVK